MTQTLVRSLPWSAPITWIAIIAACLFLGIGLRSVISPLGAAAFFGAPFEGGAGLVFVQAMGGRTIGIALTAIALILLDQRSGLAALLFAAAVVAAIDAYAVTSSVALATAAKHYAYSVGLLAFSAWVWFSA